MSGQVKGVPDNSSVVIPRLVCRDPAAAIDFCAEAFGAVELNRRRGGLQDSVHVTKPSSVSDDLQ